MAKVTFQPSGEECEAEIGDNLLKLSNKNKAGIKFSCGGVPSCAMCRVEIVSGIEHLSAMDRNETDLMGNTYFLTKKRLSCQAKIVSDGDIIVDVSEHLQVTDEPKAGSTYKSSFRKPQSQWKKIEEKEKPRAKGERRGKPRPQGKKNFSNKPKPNKKFDKKGPATQGKSKKDPSSGSETDKA